MKKWITKYHKGYMVVGTTVGWMKHSCVVAPNADHIILRVGTEPDGVKEPKDKTVFDPLKEMGKRTKKEL